MICARTGIVSVGVLLGAALGLTGACGSNQQSGQGGSSGGVTSAGGGGAGAAGGDAGVTGGGGVSDAQPPVDAAADDLVAPHSYELEVAVNVDEPAGLARVRWYGSLNPGPGASATNVTVDQVIIVEQGGQRTLAAPLLSGEVPVPTLPAIQRRIWGSVAATADELALCGLSGPELHRGTASQPDVVVWMGGSSDQGAWVGEEALAATGVIRTCHSGVSALADGTVVQVLDNPAPPPAYWVDLQGSVALTTPLALDTIAVTSLVVHGEGVSNTYSASSPWAVPGYGSAPYDSLILSDQEVGTVGATLCPDWNTPEPPQLYITYAGVADGKPFAGAGRDGQCHSGSPP